MGTDKAGTDNTDNLDDKGSGGRPGNAQGAGDWLVTARKSFEDSSDNDPVLREVSARALRFSDASPRTQRIVKIFAAAAVVAGLIGLEGHTGFLQSRIFPAIASGNRFKVVSGRASSVVTPPDGVYDRKAGYTRGPDFDESLRKEFDLVAQAQREGPNGSFLWLRYAYPIYDQKTQPGLKIYDQTGQILYDARFPQVAYDKFESLPPLLINSLLYVENRKVLDDTSDRRNHVVEPNRLFLAALGKLKLAPTRAGGSTLAMQLEKVHHSPGGSSGNDIFEKMRQIITGSSRAYKNGPDTTEERRKTVLDYINAMPLAADPRFGEVTGFSEGMMVWFGEDIREVNRLLNLPQDKLEGDQLRRVAKIYRETLSLVMAVKKPSGFILHDRESLEDRVNRFLPALADVGVITQRLCDAALAQKTEFSNAPVLQARANTLGLKSVDSLRINFMQTLGRKNIFDLHDLDQIDANLVTTHDGKVSAGVQRILKELGDPETARKRGLVGYRLLADGQAPNVIYSISLTENTENAILQRVQADNFDGQLNLNQNSMLQLGSTSKARTVDLYLKTIEDVYKEHAGKTPQELRAVAVAPKDRLTRWAVDYLAAPNTDKSLDAMLEAALDRQYPASPHESFFTGGGVHTFENFDPKDNGGVFSIRQALTESINLPITRLGNDIVNHVIYHKMKIDPAIFTDASHPSRRVYLEKFAQMEGQDFLETAWKEQKGKNAEELVSLLAGQTRRTPAHLAVVHRTVLPDASLEKFEEFIRKEATGLPAKADIQKLYADYAPEKFSMGMERDKLSLQDRGYVTGIHPMKLWLAAQQARTGNPKWDRAEWDKATADSARARVVIYEWLMKPDRKERQDSCIHTMLEREAFTHIHAEYKTMGYPFGHLVPSIATFAMGVSGDTPAALAEFMSILQNEGLRKPVINITDVDLATGTPYERQYDRRLPPPVRARSPEVARHVLGALHNVVEHGTARRIRGAFKLSDGRVLDLYAKTGTGDNRLERHTARGALISSDAVDRTGTVMVGIGNKFALTITAYVKDDAGHYKFTSSLPLQVVLTIAEELRPVIERGYADEPAAEKTAAPLPPAPR